MQSIDHVNLVVDDLPGITRFYEQLLGLKVTKRATISGEWIGQTVGLNDVQADVVYLEMPEGPRIELIHYHRPKSPAHPPGPANTRGIGHIAFRVSQIDDWVSRLTEAGVRFFSAVQTVPEAQVTYANGVRKRLVYFRDPEGNILEFCEYR